MDKPSMVANGFVILERHTMREGDGHIVRGCDGTEGPLLTNTDTVDGFGMPGDFTHGRQRIKQKCMAKPIKKK